MQESKKARARPFWGGPPSFLKERSLRPGGTLPSDRPSRQARRKELLLGSEQTERKQTGTALAAAFFLERKKQRTFTSRGARPSLAWRRPQPGRSRREPGSGSGLSRAISPSCCRAVSPRGARPSLAWRRPRPRQPRREPGSGPGLSRAISPACCRAVSPRGAPYFCRTGGAGSSGLPTYCMWG